MGFELISFLNQQASLTDATLTSSYGTVKTSSDTGGNDESMNGAKLSFGSLRIQDHLF